MDIIVSGRRCHISDQVREQVSERILPLERFRDRVQRVEVEFTVNETKGSPDGAVGAEITLRSQGPAVRAEATGEEKMVAFERALDRLTTQLRRASDRRKHHKGLRHHNGQLSHPDRPVEPLVAPSSEPLATDDDDAPAVTTIGGLEVVGDGPLVVRHKEFTTSPHTLAQALDEMELVGHDFFLYQDAETGRPSVVYRRRAYDYGVIALTVVDPERPVEEQEQPISS